MTNGRFAAPGLGPLTTAMAAGDAHAAHKSAVHAGLPKVIVDSEGRSYHPTLKRGTYRSVEGGTPSTRHAVITVAQHMPASPIASRLQQLLGAAPAAKEAPPSDIDIAAHTAAASPHNGRPNPTDGQKTAGNYKKGHAVVGAMEIAIENPQGSMRTRAGGGRWPIALQHHYGYIKGTKGKDGDPIDVFVKPGTPSELPLSAPVFVVDQNGHDGKFDEHKAMIGFKSKNEAKAAYLSNYSLGHERNVGAITEMPLKAFKEWATSSGPQKGALARQRGNRQATSTPVAKPAAATPKSNDSKRTALPKVMTSHGPVTVDNRWDVASYANSAKGDDHAPVVVDHSIPEHSPTLKGKDGKPAHLWRHVAEHEVQERKAMREAVAKFKQQHGREPKPAELKEIYEDKHINVATPAERKMVEADGVDFDQYTRTANGYIKALRDRKHPNPPPFPMHVDPELANQQQS
jgi:hypothetical protein